MLLSEDEEGMTGLITGLEKYLDRKNLTLNVDKTKAMRFRAGRGRKKGIDDQVERKKVERSERV